MSWKDSFPEDMIEVKDSLEFLKKQDDFSADIIFCDPPYALGSEIIIKEDGKPDYRKARDFMDKWDMPTGEYWEQFFKEAFRVLKHGGYILMYGIDRQNFLFKYYAHLAGLQGRQSLYWYNIQNFPKATDLSKMIDKYFGDEREVIGKNPHGAGNGSVVGLGSKKVLKKEFDITVPATPLAKKYDGYKYSQASLKQVVEEIMVFQKPYKTGSCLHDTLAMENGDNTITCGALNIDDARIPTNEKWEGKTNIKDTGVVFKGSLNTQFSPSHPLGRFPAQAFVDEGTAEILDKQGDCSKILHKCNYEEGEFDIFNYNPKVSKKERNAGLDGFENVKNNHPTVKPIALNEKILKLFKTPNPQTILIPFAGSGSEVISAIRVGFENVKACEINEEYVEIAKARIGYWKLNKENKKG